MDDSLNKEIPEVRLRAFRAIDEPDTCALFVEGHAYVLTSIGVTKVTSSKIEWIYNPAVFVIVVESLDGKKIYGGARVHVAGGTEALPIEQATGKLDPAIYPMVWEYAQHGTGEICGLWNSREIAGYGIGSIFLTRAAVAISSQIGLRSLFALCAPYTVKMAQMVGYNIETSIGNEGTFYYPKLDLLATSMILQDVDTLSSADDEERAAIFKLRNELNIIRTEQLRKKTIVIHYEIKIPNLEKWNLKQTITAFNKSDINKEVDDSPLNIL
ncbi:hypothetical protein [Mucilaginibacter sp.]|uniref:hypothetical protein n=1 Tax=Mucilaginibacter sp. TaxID=1882438 RepID=UPI002602C08F|nr:hypothetical protein [Mucilaginibacter sp.]MDB4926702.1 hypothetical protein [Mucilaginibacter sp.]